MTTSNSYQNTMISNKSTASTKHMLISAEFTEAETLTYGDLTELVDTSYTRQTPSWTLDTGNKNMKWTPTQYTFDASHTLYGWAIVDNSNNLIDVMHFVVSGTSTPTSIAVGVSNPLDIGEITSSALSSPPAVVS